MAQPIPLSDQRAGIDEVESDAGDAPDLLAEVGERLPAWMTSLATHLSLFILLVLASATGNGWGHGIGTSVDCRIGGSSGEGGDGMELAGPLATPSDGENAVAQSDVAPEAFDLAELFDKPQFEEPTLALDPVASAIAPARPPGPTSDEGDGHGQGLGRGDGEGDDDEAAGGSGLGFAPVRTQLFGIGAEAARFVYVFDRSQSMDAMLAYTRAESIVFSITPLEAAKRELLSSLADLDSRQQFQIVFYNHQMSVFDGATRSRRLLTATEEAKKRAATYINQIRAEGHTLHVDPLEAAIRMRPDVIFLLTDGEPKDDPSPYQLAHLQKLNKGRSRINVIQFVSSPQQPGTLAQLARENGGKHLFFDIARLGPKAETRGAKPSAHLLPGKLSDPAVP